MQAQQPAYSPAAQVHGAGPALPATGSDQWTRSVVLVILATAIIGLLLVGALLLMYFGTVQSKGKIEIVASNVVDPPAARVVPKPISVMSGSTAAARAADVETTPPREKPPVATLPVANPAATAAATAAVPAPRSVPALASAPAQTTVREERAAAAPAPPVPTTAQREPVTPAPAESPVVAAAVSPSASARSIEVPSRTETVAPLPATPAVVAAPPAAEGKAVQVAAIEPPAAARPSPAANPRLEPPEALPPFLLRPVSRPQPQFPSAALREGVTKGSVVARLTVETDGKVSTVTIVSSIPPRLFDRAAQSALAGWRFEPIPRPTTAQVELAFRAE